MMTRKERLLSSLAFYGAYHNHPGNVLIHCIFVPTILWSAMVLLAATGPLLDVGCVAVALHACCRDRRIWRDSDHCGVCAAHERRGVRRVAHSRRLDSLTVHACAARRRRGNRSPPARRSALPVPFSGACLLWLVCALTYVYLEPVSGAGAALFYLGLLAAAERYYAASGADALNVAAGVHVLSWFMQVVPGHVILERRRPALLDSLLQSLLLAPFFVVLEVWFALGYRPALHAELQARTRFEVGKLRAKDARARRE
jgi:uncharacterized membrane protein YGL010W